MHPTVFEAFERLCRRKGVSGRVLEVGAVPSGNSLLSMDCLNGAVEKVGINYDGPYSFADFKILKGTANDLSRFADASFDVVLSNATLEHDRCFWKTLAEIRRVTKPGGFVAIGVPGLVETTFERRFRSVLGRLPVIRRMGEWAASSTLTFRIHNHPGDYWRFSEQAVREVFFEGFAEIEIQAIMVPPRLIGCGIKRSSAG